MLHNPREQAAAWLAEALVTGNALAPLPPPLVPRTMVEGERIAVLMLEAAGLVPCGLRLAPGPGRRQVPGPLLEGRLLPNGTRVALRALHHPRIAPAVLARLAEDLPRRGDAMPRFTSLHPALDVAASRFATPPASEALAAADLGGLGLVVVGKAGTPPEDAAWPVALRPKGRRGVPHAIDVPAALRQAVAAARRAGGLPKGALLLAVLGPGAEAPAGSEWTALLGGLGRADAGFVG